MNIKDIIENLDPKELRSENYTVMITSYIVGFFSILFVFGLHIETFMSSLGVIVFGVISINVTFAISNLLSWIIYLFMQKNMFTVLRVVLYMCFPTLSIYFMKSDYVNQHQYLFGVIGTKFIFLAVTLPCLIGLVLSIITLIVKILTYLKEDKIE